MERLLNEDVLCCCWWGSQEEEGLKESELCREVEEGANIETETAGEPIGEPAREDEFEPENLDRRRLN